MINSKTDGDTESGWFVQVPTGPSDFFNVRYDGVFEVAGINIGVADFGATMTYPQVGIYDANMGLDPTGLTPDLASPVAEALSPPILGGPIGDRCLVTFGGTHSVSGTIHATVQLPPGDSGLLAIHADSDRDTRGGGSPFGDAARYTVPRTSGSSDSNLTERGS